jgi:hypothetical protein
VACVVLKSHCVMSQRSHAQLPSLDAAALEAVSGGASGAVNALNQLSSLASALNNIQTKTSGFDNTQMMLLMILAMDSPRGCWRRRCW